MAETGIGSQSAETNMEQPAETSAEATPASATKPSSADEAGAAHAAQGGSEDVPADVAMGEAPAPMAPAYVYAIGRIEMRFPSLAVEKELAQTAGREETSGLTDRQAVHAVLSKPENRYLVRQLCWVLTIEGLETYILQPRDPADFDLLVEALRAAPSPDDVDVVIGQRGPVAPPEMCSGLVVPIVVFDQIYSFDVESLIKSIPRPKQIAAKDFEPATRELFHRIMQVTDNAGAMDEHRTLNYVAVRYPAIYEMITNQHAEDRSLSAVEVRPSRLSGVRNIVDVIFSYTHRKTDVTEKHFVRVDVTEEFPFLVSKLSPYYDR